MTFLSLFFALVCVTFWATASLEQTHVNFEEEEIWYHCVPGSENSTITVPLHIDDLINQALNNSQGIRLLISADGPVDFKITDCGGKVILETVDPIDFEHVDLDRSWIQYLKDRTEICHGLPSFKVEIYPLGHCSGRLTVKLVPEAPTQKDSPDSNNTTFQIELAENQTTLFKTSIGNALEKALHIPHLPHHPPPVSIVSELNAPVLFRVEKCGFTQMEMHPMLHWYYLPLSFEDVQMVIRMSQLRCFRETEGNRINLRVTAGRPTKGKLSFRFAANPDNFTTTTTEPTPTKTAQTTATTKSSEKTATKTNEFGFWTKMLLRLISVAVLVAVTYFAVFFWKRRTPRPETLSFANPVQDIPMEDLTIQ